MRLFAVLILALLVVLPARSEAQQKLRVIASFSILADVVSQVGGEHVAVATLVPAMGDAHVFQPTPSDARSVATAGLLVSHGLNFEPWLDRLVAASGFNGPRVVATAGITPRRMGAQAGHDHGHNHGHETRAGAVDDPHLWHDLQRMQAYVATIAAGLAAADPAHAEQYRQRGAAYAAELKALDDWAVAQFAPLPVAYRKAITQHDAFGYLADRFRIVLLAPQGVTTDAEASAEAVARLIRQVKRERVQALFFENIANPRLIEQIAREAKVKVGGRLYSDALSPPGGEADSFVKMYRLNITRLVAAMQRD
ncbi:MAG: zinc ABC transporter substrate-binding protein [Ferrovibrio sp.]|uniref:metal ABC transporter solute-binding protein, Zn/Mn family n=1 Tax=Ferrovibrio sp. TaxID=1917215 RepID=UPI0026367ECC|nr:zinc ABC transporter substrate-binding protein [Ferrovibrio sp.]MCW0235175.1 zinc ABC transporter substrate-binding protein [Ferrovibrio sp.]